MRRLIISGLFVIALCLTLVNFVSGRGLAVKGEYDTILLNFREDIPREAIENNLSAIASLFQVTPKLDNEFSARDNVYIIQGDKTRLQELRQSEFAKNTEYIEPNYIYKLPKLGNPRFGQVTRVGNILPVNADESGINDSNTEQPKSATAPNDPMYDRQWHMQAVDVEGAWQHTKGKGVTVAVIDTGITKVRDLVETNFVKGYDFVNEKEDASDDNGHGTHVAGTIAQATNNSYGVVGVAYEASLMPLKVLDGYGSGTVADIAEAIRFAADNGADVINMSLGGGGESQLMKDAINYAHSKGVVIVAAAGNENDNGVAYPARYPHVIGVSATGRDGTKADYSNFGAGVDISAPGGSSDGPILQETVDMDNKGEGTFLGLQGTSMASPHVAGTAALIKASGVKDPDAVEKILLQSAQPVNDDILNYYGAGRLNAAVAAQTAAEGQNFFQWLWNNIKDILQDFFRWLWDNGYLNPGFWIDGGAIALIPKLIMVIGSYLIAWFLRTYFPFTWTWSLATGLVVGSSGFFPLRMIHVFDVPHWPFRLAGSSIAELGNILPGTDPFNPIFASVLIPLGLAALLLGHPSWKWFAIGSTIGMTACLGVSAIFDPAVWGLGSGILARLFLAVNAIACYKLAHLIISNEPKTVS
ncbi:S8 family peptidase [Calothrix sp. NIES-3974]|uniref:S8 family peptidase n=1 Tax=Calothrix sp. NIES-3974 TaxID=2005462 RepID=UPI000B60BC9F|nr:S8 family peptidase [Calothrix sp. NIES-3974]BAZ04077.1 peptidase S8/S53 [Calothrix sp. NIES-3974]